MAVKFQNVTVNDITCKSYKEHLLINYNDTSLRVQSKWMTLDTFGVPRADKYHLTDESRKYLQIPLNGQDLEFENFVKKLDDYFNSFLFRQKYLDEKQQHFTYVHILKTSQNDKYPSSVKLKLDVSKTEVLKMNDTEKFDIVNVKTIDDFKQNIPYKCEYRMIFQPSKIWFMSKNYGVKINLIKIQVKQNKQQIVDEVEFEGDE